MFDCPGQIELYSHLGTFRFQGLGFRMCEGKGFWGLGLGEAGGEGPQTLVGLGF